MGIIEGPELLLELQICEEESDPDPGLQPEPLPFRLEYGPAHARHQQDRVKIGPVHVVGAPASKAAAPSLHTCLFQEGSDASVEAVME